MKEKFFLLFAGLVIFSCTQNNKLDKLRQLESKRDALTAQIEQLRKEIAQENKSLKNIPSVRVQRIEPERFRHYIKIQGTVESDNNILIPAQSSGVVKKIHVHEGQFVKKGTLLAELDGAILEHTIAELEVNLSLAKTAYERQNRLWEKNIGSEMQFLQAKTKMEALEKRLAATREQYRLTKITAPISGSVDEILLKEGEAVAAGFGTIRIVKLSALKITAQLSEDYITKTKVGDTVHIFFPTLKKEMHGSIRSKSQVIDPQNRTFALEVSLPTNTGNIRPNMLSVLTISDYSNPDAVAVPINSIQRTGNSQFVFTAQPTDKENGLWTVQKKTIETGLTFQDKTEVLNGLDANEHVITLGFQELAQGQKVKVQQRINSSN